MNKLKGHIHDEQNGLDYVLVGDYYIPAIDLAEEDDDRPIGKWGMPNTTLSESHTYWLFPF